MVNSDINTWWHDRTVCVTGADGRIGLRLVQLLYRLGAGRVVGMARNIPKRSELPVEWIKGNILDGDDVERAVAGSSVVFHLAALNNVGLSISDPVQFFETNGLGTAKVMEACRRCGVERIVFASTGHVYGVPETVPVREDHAVRPVSPYAASKVAGESAVLAYALSFGIKGFIARISNVYGFDIGPETALGLALKQAASGGPVLLRNLSPVRDFIYLEDVVEALVRLSAADFDNGSGCLAINVSSGRGISLRDAAEVLVQICLELGLGNIEIRELQPHLPELVPQLVLDNSLLRELTGWQPQFSMEQGLATILKMMLQRV